MSFASVEDLGGMSIELDPASLDKGKHYRWVQDRSENIQKRRAQGYEVVLRSEGVRLLYEEEKKETADDLLRVGDTVLMACRKEDAKKRLKATQELSQNRLGAVENAFQGTARRKGVRSITTDD
jgi:hypothetical protein